MRILFDPAVYDMRNKGNVVLLQVAVERLSKFWPNASLEVITASPYLLRLYFPTARPASPYGKYAWLEDSTTANGILWRIPRRLLRSLFELREEVWYRWPKVGPSLTSMKLKSFLGAGAEPPKSEADAGEKQIEEAQDTQTSNQTLDGIELFVATGAQYMSDACKNDALQVLDRLETAAQLGISTAMVGQGIGPIEDPELCARAMEVLPQVDLFLVRERLVAPQLLRSFGVDPSRVLLTGDDAIEMAYRARTTVSGRAIGVSMRIAPYTQVGASHVEILQPILLVAATKHKAKLIAIPISHSAHELDDKVIRQLLGHQGHISTGLHRRFDTPQEIIKRVGQCRLVVTATFHTAVFALGQGIPAVCLAQSRMYVEKFLGLVDQFGPGCQVIYLDDEQVQQKILDAVDTTWKSAEQVRPELLKAAERQIEWGHAGYQRIYELVESRNREKLFSAEAQV